MKSSSGKTVALIDPLWVGHHPVYFGQFTASFLRAGARVIGLSPQPEDARRETLEAADPDIAATLDERSSFQLLRTGGRSLFNGRFEGDPVRSFRRWRRAADAISVAEKSTGWKVDLVFFPYLDSYLRFIPFPFIPAITIKTRWSGLYLRNHHHGETPSFKSSLRLLAKGDALMKSSLCREIGVLDERFNPLIAERVGKPVLSFPDVTQTLLPESVPPLVSDILAKAAGRKIIGVIGLEERKGVMTMLRVALESARRGLPYFFVFAGIYVHWVFSESNQALIAEVLGKIRSGELKNIHFDPDAVRIPTEADFNALFSRFDIAWAAYENFQGSSGTLSKAAAFEIPSLATSGECIGHRVETYRIGLTIPEADDIRALDAIRRIFAGIDWQDLPLRPKYADYRVQHSVARLDGLLANLLA